MEHMACNVNVSDSQSLSFSLFLLPLFPFLVFFLFLFFHPQHRYRARIVGYTPTQASAYASFLQKEGERTKFCNIDL